MTIFKTYSLGCRVNQAEIETITEQLLSLGYAHDQNSSRPNFILLNTCVVTQKAEKETRKEIRKLKRLYPRSKLIVLGCGVDNQQKFAGILPKADLFIANKDKKNAVNLLLKRFNLRRQRNIAICQSNNVPISKYQKSGKTLIKIQDGCNYHCSYCIVPSLRGKSASVPINKIINQINNRKSAEIKEIILTGINLSLYGQDLKPKVSFLDLLKKILKETKIKKISLTSLDPQMINRELVDLFISNPRLSKNLHFSLQSGSPTVLKRMNRHPNLSEFIKLVNELKSKDPRFVFSADIIVGFPDESENEFRKTLQLIKQIKLDRAHLFRFSPRPGTIAYQKIQKGQWQDLPLLVKKEREKIIDNSLPAR